MNSETIKSITASVIAIIIVGGTVYSAIYNLPATPYLSGISGLIIGFYFGTTKAGSAIAGKIFK